MVGNRTDRSSSDTLTSTRKKNNYSDHPKPFIPSIVDYGGSESEAKELGPEFMDKCIDGDHDSSLWLFTIFKC